MRDYRANLLALITNMGSTILIPISLNSPDLPILSPKERYPVGLRKDLPNRLSI